MGKLLTASLAMLTLVVLVVFGLSMTNNQTFSGLRNTVGPTIYDPVISILLAVMVLLTGFSAEAPRLEGSKEIALVAMVIGLGSAGRVLFALAPNISPVDWLTLCTGIVFGPVTGFTVGAGTMLISNFYLGQGPWTIYQMVGMGLLGVLGGLLGKWRSMLGTKSLVTVGLAWGFIYGIITSLFWVLMISSTLNWASFATYLASGIPFYTMQGIGNALLLMFLGERTLVVLERFRRKFSVELRESVEEVGTAGLR
jgi:energy-coupling factor transport system substrate-specific component